MSVLVVGGAESLVLSVGSCQNALLASPATVRVDVGSLSSSLTPPAGAVVSYLEVRQREPGGDVGAIWRHNVGIWVCYKEPCDVYLISPGWTGNGRVSVMARRLYLESAKYPLTQYVGAVVAPVQVTPPPGADSYVCNRTTTLNGGAITVPAGEVTSLTWYDTVAVPAGSAITFYTLG